MHELRMKCLVLFRLGIFTAGGVALGLLLALISGCAPSDRNWATDTTAHKLAILGKTVARFVAEDPDAPELGSLQSLLSAAAERNWLDIDDSETGSFEVDNWKRAFRWRKTGKGANTVVRVVSDGANGIAEGGEGDDLYVEIRASPLGNPQVTIKTMTKQGNARFLEL